MVADVRDGRAVSLAGHPDHPITRGFLCTKSRSGYLKRIYSRERITHPMVKGKGGWRRIDWAEAMDRAAGALTAFRERPGPLSVLYYQGAGNMGVLRLLGSRFFDRYGPVTQASGSLCDGAGLSGLKRSYGAAVPHSPEDLVNSNLIMIWGRNPAVTNVHLVPFIKAARRRGALIVLVDPVVSRSAALAHLHLRLRPGTDGLLALGMIKGLMEADLVDWGFLRDHTGGFESLREIVDAITLDEVATRCGLSAPLIRDVARRYGEARPASILLGMGGQHYADGAVSYRLVGTLPVLAGYVGVAGGGVSFSGSSTGAFDKGVLRSDEGGADGGRPETRSLPKPAIGRAILSAADPSVRMAWIAGANPVAQSPDSIRVHKALSQLDYVIVADAFLTDTVDCADLFLPVSTFLEREDLVGSYGHPYVGPVNPAVAPVGESRSDLEIFQDLAERLGFGDVMAGSAREWLERFSASLCSAAGISFDELMAGPVRNPALPDVPFADRVFPTPTGRYEFIDLLFQPMHRSRRYPLRLISPKPSRTILSDSTPRGRRGPAVAWCHTRTASKRGLSEGQVVEVRSCNGAIRARLSLEPDQRRDTVVVESGGWLKHGRGVNLLTDDSVSFQGEGACYFETDVNLKGLEERKEKLD